MNINLTLLGQTIMFAMFVWFCMKFIWPPLMGAMAERKKTIEEGLLAAERGREEHAQAQQKAEELIASTKNQAKDIIDNADKQANVMIDNAKGAAVEEADKIKAHAKAEVSVRFLRKRSMLKRIKTCFLNCLNHYRSGRWNYQQLPSLTHKRFLTLQSRAALTLSGATYLALPMQYCLMAQHKTLLPRQTQAKIKRFN